MSPNSTPLHDRPQSRCYRPSFPTEEEKEDVDIMIERFARSNYYTSEDFEFSFACRMEKDELIQDQIPSKGYFRGVFEKI